MLFRRRSISRGFTLVELLVVIAIIGILVALLLPAVQSAREAARRMQCQNNIKQICLALHNYESNYKTFPPGNLGGNGSCNDDGLAWYFMILPFCEQAALYDNISTYLQTTNISHSLCGAESARPLAGVYRSHHNKYARPINGGTTVVSAFRCPTSAMPHLVPATFTVPGLQSFGALPPQHAGMVGYATTSYKGNGGGDLDGSGMLSKLFESRGGRKISDVSDGLSNTSFVAESDYVTANGTIAPTVVEDWPIWLVSPNTDESIRFEGESSEDPINGFVSPTKMAFARSDDCAFSWHPGGALVGLGDGSVRFVSQNININLWSRICAINDGGVVGEF